MIEERRAEEESQKRNKVLSLKLQWERDSTLAKHKYLQSKYKQIQDMRSQDLIYKFEANQEKKK